MGLIGIFERALDIKHDQALGLGSTSIDNASEKPHSYNRFMGGRNRVNQPFITGYFHVLLRPPAGLLKDNNDVQSWFHSTCESFTPPSFTPILADVPALGGNNSSFLAGLDITRSFTLAFREYQRLPILGTINEWVSRAFNPNYGMSSLNNYVPYNYKGDCIVVITTPQIHVGGGSGGASIDEDAVEQVFYFDGVFPEQVPTDSLSSDISSHDGLQLSVSFRFDGWPMIGGRGSNNPITEQALRILNDAVSTNVRADYWDINDLQMNRSYKSNIGFVLGEDAQNNFAPAAQ